MAAVNTMPISIAPRTPRVCKAAITNKPSMEIAAVGVVRLPSPTMVPVLATMTPASANPMNAMNSPTPPPTAENNERGTALMISCRTPETVSSKNAAPDKNTQPSAVCHGRPMPFTTVYVK
jgi:hypothetical protein